ncbi:MAG: hypothetical protein ACPK85_02375 [Methanosarcina sp.]
MNKNTQDVLKGPGIALVAVGAVINAILFFLMFRFADQENLTMVIVTTLLIAVVSIGVAKGLVSISRRNMTKKYYK